MTPGTHWFVTADGRRAALFSCHAVPGGRLHVDPLRHVENAHEAEHEHHRPLALGRGPSANAAQHFAGHGHADEEEQRRFAREVAAWLGDATRELRLDRVEVFAASRFLGLLRDEMGDLGGKAGLREGELAQLEPGELAEHPALRRALEAAAGAGPLPPRVPPTSERRRPR
jgi:hypothetical protein